MASKKQLFSDISKNKVEYSSLNYSDKAKILKSLKLINYDLRKKLNSGQKSYITKLSKLDFIHQAVFLKSQHRLQINKIPKTISNKKLNNVEIPTFKGHAYIALQSQKQRAYLSKGGVIYRLVGENNVRSRIDFFPDNLNFIEQAELIFKSKKPNMRVTITGKSGDAPIWDYQRSLKRSRTKNYKSTFESIEELNYYLENNLIKENGLTEGGATLDEFINFTSVVIIEQIKPRKKSKKKK